MASPLLNLGLKTPGGGGGGSATDTTVEAIEGLDATNVQGALEELAAIPTRATVIEVTTNTYAPEVGVDGRWFYCTHASGCAVSLPSDATEPFPTGTMLTFEQGDTDSAVTFAAGSGATLRCPPSLTAATAEQYAVVQAHKRAANTWIIYGNLAAA